MMTSVFVTMGTGLYHILVLNIASSCKTLVTMRLIFLEIFTISTFHTHTDQNSPV